MPPSIDELHAKTRIIAEQLYGTAQHPDHIPVTTASQAKLDRLHPSTVLFKVIDDEPVSWIVVIPTTKALTSALTPPI